MNVAGVPMDPAWPEDFKITHISGFSVLVRPEILQTRKKMFSPRIFLYFGQIAIPIGPIGILIMFKTFRVSSTIPQAISVWQVLLYQPSQWLLDSQDPQELVPNFDGADLPNG